MNRTVYCHSIKTDARVVLNKRFDYLPPIAISLSPRWRSAAAAGEFGVTVSTTTCPPISSLGCTKRRVSPTLCKFPLISSAWKKSMVQYSNFLTLWFQQLVMITY